MSKPKFEVGDLCVLTEDPQPYSWMSSHGVYGFKGQVVRIVNYNPYGRPPYQAKIVDRRVVRERSNGRKLYQTEHSFPIRSNKITKL